MLILSASFFRSKTQAKLAFWLWRSA